LELRERRVELQITEGIFLWYRKSSRFDLLPLVIKIPLTCPETLFFLSVDTRHGESREE